MTQEVGGGEAGESTCNSPVGLWSRIKLSCLPLRISVLFILKHYPFFECCYVCHVQVENHLTSAQTTTHD